VLRAVCAVVVGGALAAGAAAFASPQGDDPGVDSASAAVAPSRAGARPVTLTVSIRGELRCGRLSGRTVSLALPAQLRLPSTVAASSVTVGGKPASAVHVVRRTLAIELPVPTGVMCDSIAPGTVKVVVDRTANLGNPTNPGRYPLTVLYRNERLPASLRIVR
jgi:hypothetical protein